MNAGSAAKKYIQSFSGALISAKYSSRELQRMTVAISKPESKKSMQMNNVQRPKINLTFMGPLPIGTPKRCLKFVNIAIIY